MDLLRNPRHREIPEIRHRKIVGIDAPNEPLRLLAHCPKYTPTPLCRLDRLASECGVKQIHIKDERHRLGLQSFKALGGIYAIFVFLQREAEKRFGRTIDPTELLAPPTRELAKSMTFVCASDGNHGRSVAAGARLVGANCIVFLHPGVSDRRVKWIADLGATIVRTKGTYDESVEAANIAARSHGWTLIADTSETNHDEAPGLIMQGYTVIVAEMLRQFEESQSFPTHIFVQAGVGGLAAAVCGHLAARFGVRAPTTVVAEPEASRCLLESCRQGKPTEVPPTVSTIYAMLECNRPSSLAWDILDSTASFFMSVADSYAIPAMRKLGKPSPGDPRVVAGESGAAGFAAFSWANSSASTRGVLGLGNNSVVALINTEGATDPIRYKELVGIDESN
jgi:diaminopropionate ammonia-lyase